MALRGLSVLLHGEAGAGKSTVGTTGPLPRLIMDVENSSRFLFTQRLKYWDPMTEPPPVWDGTWDLCVVITTHWTIAQKTLDFLRSGQHPFRSVVVDSISEMQVKAQEAINNRDQMKTQHWGQLLQYMGGFLRDLRDMVGTPQSIIELMVLISTSKMYGECLKPYLQGQIASQVPYLFDITAYLYVDQLQNPQTGEIEEHRYLFTGKNPRFEAKSRVPMLPKNLIDPDFTVIMNNVFPQAPAPQQVQNPQMQQLPPAQYEAPSN